MKSFNKPSTQKLVNRFDNELKELLMADLKAYKTRTQFVSKPQQLQTSLSAA